MHDNHQFDRRRRGFSLLELSVVLSIIGAVSAVSVSAGSSMVEREQVQNSQAELDAIRTALLQFSAINQMLPCPAVAASEGVATPDCADATPPAGLLRVTTTGDAGRFVRIGQVPVKTLNLPDALATDAWGNPYLYAVEETQLALGGSDRGAGIAISGSGGIDITNEAALVVLSHGADGRGGDALTCETAFLDGRNCDDDGAFAHAAFDDGPGSRHYDDLLVWAGRLQVPGCPLNETNGTVGGDSLVGGDCRDRLNGESVTSPLGIAGLRFWIDASDIDGLGNGNAAHAAGAAVPVWTNKADSGNPALSDLGGGTAPTFTRSGMGGKPALSFGGAGFLGFDARFLHQTDYTIFAVTASPVGLLAPGYYLGTADGATINHSLHWGYAIDGLSHNADYSANPLVTIVNPLTDSGVPLLASGSRDTTGREIRLTYKGGSEHLPPELGTRTNSASGLNVPGSTSGRIGAGRYDSKPSQGIIAEVLMYDRKLTEAEYTQVRNYLAAKYGISQGASPLARDTLTGRGGADRFNFSMGNYSAIGSGRDVITDFGTGDDTIELYGYGFDPATAWRGMAALAGGGVKSIRRLSSGSDTVLQIDTTGAGMATIEIGLKNFTGPLDTSSFRF